MRLFIGKEAEGVLKGFQTLFIAGDVPYEEIVKYAAKHQCAQLYFGADGRTFVNWETVRRCSTSATVHYVTVETTEPIPIDLVHRSNLFIMLPVQDQLRLQEILDSVVLMTHKVQLKFDTSVKTYVGIMDQFVSNDCSDINNDKEVWNEISSERRETAPLS